jgi:hypothetical protein
MEKMHIMKEDDPVFARSAPITVGAMARALADSKSALSSTGKLADRVDDVEVDLDALIARIEKSTAEHRATIKSIESSGRATVESLAKLRASIDTPALLAKMASWEEAHLERLHKAHGRGSTLDEFKAQMAADHKSFRKRDALTKYDFDDDGVQTFERRPESQWRIVR